MLAANPEAGLERPLDQVSQIAVIVPIPTSCHGMDRWAARIMLTSGNESLFSVVAARHASAIAWSRRCRRLYRDGRIPPPCLAHPSVGKSPPAARALAFVPLQNGGEARARNGDRNPNPTAP